MQKVFLSDVLKTIKKAYIWNDEISQQILERAMMQLPPADDVAGWIPVSEGLPETDLIGEEFLVTIKEDVNRPFVMTLIWEGTDGEWNDGFGRTSEDVTAWMPLPEPYEEGE